MYARHPSLSPVSTCGSLYKQPQRDTQDILLSSLWSPHCLLTGGPWDALCIYFFAVTVTRSKSSRPIMCIGICLAWLFRKVFKDDSEEDTKKDGIQNAPLPYPVADIQYLWCRATKRNSPLHGTILLFSAMLGHPISFYWHDRTPWRDQWKQQKVTGSTICISRSCLSENPNCGFG